MLVISLIENLLIEELGNYFRGVFGKLRLKLFSKKLKKEVEVSILEKYGDRIYYLDFDRFLIEQNVLEKIIKNFLNQDVLQSKTINQSVDFYIFRDSFCEFTSICLLKNILNINYMMGI